VAGAGKELWRWQHGRAEASPADLEMVEFAAIPGWDGDDHAAALGCYLQSAEIAGQPVPRLEIVETLRTDACKARAFFEETFEAFRVRAAPGLLTAYFEPVLKGSRTRSARFPIPVYRRPDGLIPLPAGHPLAASGLTAGRPVPGGLEPYFTRGEIEAGALAGRGLELLYLSDALEAFVMHVQGSGLVELDDGSSVRLSFDGKNGHPYTSISRLLIECGALDREEAHLDGMLAWLRSRSDPRVYLNENRSYIFFRILEEADGGPNGSLGTPLTAGRSLAADPLYHASGTPIWVNAPKLIYAGKPLGRLLIAQDTGSAIVGPQRGDIFTGHGREAGEIAGRIRHACSFIGLKPKRG
jgi:membrane-bound lytic murein transglycosylase A